MPGVQYYEIQTWQSALAEFQFLIIQNHPEFSDFGDEIVGKELLYLLSSLYISCNRKNVQCFSKVSKTLNILPITRNKKTVNKVTRPGLGHLQEVSN